MRKIVYYVASSVDGFIMDEGEHIEKFVMDGSGVEKYLNDLKNFDTVLMGRKTYEFGYKFGMKAGDAPYAGMKHYIFSNTLRLENADESIKICGLDLTLIEKLKNENGTDIYLCGGGEFAGWLLDNGKIDVLKIKLNRLILGKGVRLFGNSTREVKLELIESQIYEKGLQIIEYKLIYQL